MQLPKRTCENEAVGRRSPHTQGLRCVQRRDCGTSAVPSRFAASGCVVHPSPTLARDTADVPSGRSVVAEDLDWGRGSWLGLDVGVVAEKNGQATVATETSRSVHARGARSGMPV